MHKLCEECLKYVYALSLPVFLALVDELTLIGKFEEFKQKLLAVIRQVKNLCRIFIT